MYYGFEIWQDGCMIHRDVGETNYEEDEAIDVAKDWIFDTITERKNDGLYGNRESESLEDFEIELVQLED